MFSPVTQTHANSKKHNRKDGVDVHTQLNWNYGPVTPDPAPQWRSNGSPCRVFAYSTKLRSDSKGEHYDTNGSDKSAIRPFPHVNIPEAELTDLRRRINATKWPERELVADATQGVQLATTQALARYWATEYDWRKGR